MRYGERVDLICVSEERYDPEIGEYVGGNEVFQTVPAFVMDMSLSRQEMVYGSFKSGRKMVYLQRKPSFCFEKIRYLGKFILLRLKSKTVKFIF
ncbi:hypothetical protein STRDD10_00608 [Streptococcus sp. DD10]|uniref:hypothetical protein n=1 Tax=Streptococcus sp. DD10 TaxID=1777878 RepID=UPI00079AB701|nr:hypothetical protein [Streptococcus sp. DD10]KXT74872.1 hypothetical protein STRDD10_00608 [Streptococcus sp. DD10]